MKLPGPDHPISIAPAGTRVRVRFAGRLIADTTGALAMQEAGYARVLYIPRADADMGVLERSDHHSHCAYKGDAGYFTVRVNGRSAENAVWTYEQPFPAMAEIAGHLAFYAKRVDAIDEEPA